jgi:hypothetical protein
MWTIGDQSSELVNFLCGATSSEYGVREALLKPALFLVVGLGVWAYDRVQRRKAQVHSAALPVRIRD